MSKSNNAELLSIGEAAREVGYSVDHLRKLDDQGAIVAKRINGQRFYDPASLGQLVLRAQANKRR